MSRSKGGLGGATPDIEDILSGGGAKPSGGGGREARRAAPRQTAGRGRLALICLGFVGVMAAASVRFADMAAQGGAAPEPAVAAGLVDAERAADLAGENDAAPRRARRAPIIDRNGAPLARDVATYELYLDRAAFAFPDELQEAAEQIAQAFPDRFDAPALEAELLKRRTTLLARPLTALEAQKAHDLGVPGLYLTPRYDRYYPAGAIAAHALGWVDVDGRGRAGVEAALDDALTARPDGPVALSLDLRMQRAARAALSQAMARTGARAAAGVVMSVESGEALALVSLPDFDPHQRPSLPEGRDEQEKSPLFHRAVAGRYELGSIVKTVTWAAALETGVAQMGDAYPALPPLVFGEHEIENDIKPEGVSFPAAFARSSNRVAAELALKVGRAEQKRLFDALGLGAATPIELGEAGLGAPEPKDHWGDIDTATAGFGHGVAMSPLHMAAAVASLVNGGEQVRPTLLKQAKRARAGRRVVSAETSRRMRELLRLAVTDGTGRRADAPGLRVGGKTGTAEKPAAGGYDESRSIASFVAAFPIDRPKLVVMVMLDEPLVAVDGELRSAASLTAAPAARAIIEAVAPLAGVAQAAPATRLSEF